MYRRTLHLPKLLEKKSFFLFGPRSTGKSTLIELQLRDALVIDLLDSETYEELLKRPSLLAERIRDQSQWVVIDEIQKIPRLLDEVHRLIQKKKITFLLTGSSARKLRRGAANLLAGRARNAMLFPLTSDEIPKLNIERYLNFGGLPEVYDSDEPEEDLQSYVSNYLREEIQAEAVTRNVQAFAEFLDLLAISNGYELNYEGFASDCQVSPSTIKSYLTILEDTLLGFRVPGYRRTRKRKAISRSKFYLFDIGVTHHLSKISHLRQGSEAFGRAFEHFIALELRAYLSYRRRREELCYWRSTSQMEVNFVVGDHLALEVKSSKLVQDKHLRGIRAFKEEGLVQKYWVVSFDRERRVTEDGIEIFPWREFCSALWRDELGFA